MLTKEEIQAFSNDDLKIALKNVNIVCGPITSTTRRIYENRLNAFYSVQRKKLFENSSTVEDSSHQDNIDIDKQRIHASDGSVKENQNDKIIQNGFINVEQKGGNNVSNEDESNTKNSIIIEEQLSNNNETSNSQKKGDGIIFNGISESFDENHFGANKNETFETDDAKNGDEQKMVKSVAQLDLANNSKNILNDSNVSEQEEGDGFFYGVWIPFSTGRVTVRSKPHVFVTKKDALTGAKKFSGSRFKQFKTREEAEHFSLTGPLQLSVDNIIDNVNNKRNIKSETVVPKQPDILKTPSIQEIQQYRKYIEGNELAAVENCLTNPKYLINSKDNPVIVHEGGRLNAIHVAVKCQRLNVCERILSLLNSLETYRLIYPDINEEGLEFRKRHVKDLYLNSPEKIICDTPLHMASKYGFKGIVKFLLSFSATNVNAVNKDGRKAVDMICTRASLKGQAKKDLIAEIKALFEDKAYIPLYHGQDMAKVGPPIVTTSPTVASVLNKDIRACLGPCSPCQAEKIYRMWRKPPREMKYHAIVRTDYEKGMERVGREIATQENLSYSEYWDFLDCHINLQSDDGLEKLEKYFREKSEIKKCSKTVTKNFQSKDSPLAKTKTRQPLLQDCDEIKRRLLFDNDIPTNMDDRSIRLKDTPNFNSNTQHCSSTDEECYCRCGKLLGNCNDCSVDIDIDKLVVSFRMCCTIKDDSLTEETPVTPDKSNTDQMDGSRVNEFDSPTVRRDLPDVYIFGDCPSKKDLDVMRAIDNYRSDNDYPHVEAWMNNISCVPLQDRESWPTPGSPRYVQKLKKSIMWTF